MLALMSSSPVLVTLTFTTNGTFPVPAGTTTVNIAGRGQAGTNAHTETVRQYQTTVTLSAHNKNDGSFDETTLDGGSHRGIAPAPYCDPQVPSNNNPIYDYSISCYTFEDTSYDIDVDATTGASASGLGKTFPGSTGSTPPAAVPYLNVAVIPGQSYPIIVPAGALITITYYQ